MFCYFLDLSILTKIWFIETKANNMISLDKYPYNLECSKKCFILDSHGITSIDSFASPIFDLKIIKNESKLKHIVDYK